MHCLLLFHRFFNITPKTQTSKTTSDLIHLTNEPELCIINMHGSSYHFYPDFFNIISLDLSMFSLVSLSSFICHI
jgi:hypothetical protein